MRRQVNNGKERQNAITGDRPGSAGQNAEASPTRQTNTGAIAPDNPENPATTRLRQLLPTAWAMIRPYWSSEDRWAAWGLLTVVIALTLAMVYMSVLFNQWNNTFYTALQERNRTVFFQQLAGLAGIVGFTIIFAVYQLYLNQMLEIRWRRWLTERYLRAWLADGAYYRMQLMARETDNPDQRIAEDVHLLISHTLALLMGGLRSVVTLVAFVAILWTLSGTLSVSLGGWFSVMVPGYMVWAAILYAVGGTWLTHRIGRPLVRLNYDKQRCEADFRFGLVRFRENTEGVALYRGEADELRGFRGLFESVVMNWWDIMRRQKHLTYFTSGYQQAAWIFPSLMAAPRYLNGDLTLGGLVQTIGAFSQVQSSLSFFIDSYKTIAEWCSVVERLSGFERALERVRIQAATGGGVQHVDGDGNLTIKDVDLYLPNGQPLIADVNVSILRGETVLLGGASGLGKSTLFRAVAGIWPFGRGEVRGPRDRNVLFLPQKPYLPIGTLREVVSYPMPSGGVNDVTLREALEAVGLSRLAGRLGEAGHWALQLSPGEQQRIAFARALVQKPDWLFLDEATSAVDEATEARLYRLVRERLAGTTVFSVGHRPTLRPFHSRQLLVRANGNGPASIVEVTAVPESARRGVGVVMRDEAAAMAG
jgi:vitamin B12/bleomycin/antimicrobial peptide transport system ATP-binding/permease protein